MFWLPLAAAMTASSLQPAASRSHVNLSGPDSIVLTHETTNQRIYELRGVPEKAWTEAVPSWKAATPGRSWFELQARLRPAGKWLSFGPWSASGQSEPRRSLDGQKDEGARIETDTLIVSPDGLVDFRLVANRGESEEWPEIESLLLALSGPAPAMAPDNLASSIAWGKTLDVPQRSQMNYPGGNVLCSPTSVSMLLWHWAKALDRPELDADVPEVQKGVHDVTWKGTGNWTFNMAFAAQKPGLRAYVARLRSMQDLEQWIEAGVPVATSISYDLLKGKGKRGGNDGHLVVLVGFTDEGDPVFNDPGKGTQVRQTYKRDHFRAAWATSNMTVYLVYPRTWAVPDLP